MSFRVGLLIGLLVVLSVVLWFLPREGFQSLDTSAAAPILERQPKIYPARSIAVSGPATPAQAAPRDELIMSAPETAHDPYAPPEESASIPERMRYPERMFQPPPENATRDIAEAAGVANAAASQAMHAMNAFAPEFAQNGGEFMQGIFANDTMEPSGFASY
jgi:hypothetical protein